MSLSFNKIRRKLRDINNFYIIAVDVNKTNIAILKIRCVNKQLSKEDYVFFSIPLDNYSQKILFDYNTSRKDKKKMILKISDKLAKEVIQRAKQFNEEKGISAVVTLENHKAIKIGDMYNENSKRDIYHFRLFLRAFTTHIIRYARAERMLIRTLFPQKTTSKCPNCGNKLDYRQNRQMYCPKCRYLGDRDYTATLNLAKRLVKNLFVKRIYFSHPRLLKHAYAMF